LECVHVQQKHLNTVKTERELYKEVCDEATRTFESAENTICLNKSHEPCLLDGTMHYWFDFAEQVHITSTPRQPRLIYFKTPWKCGIFSVMCEGVTHQINDFINKASTVGNNTTISYLHHYYKKHGLGETRAYLHADNC